MQENVSVGIVVSLQRNAHEEHVFNDVALLFRIPERLLQCVKSSKKSLKTYLHFQYQTNICNVSPTMIIKSLMKQQQHVKAAILKKLRRKDKILNLEFKSIPLQLNQKIKP